MSRGDPDRFYLVRHGVTIANLGRERMARENEPLLPAGREQARMLAGRVGALGIESIWTSPLDRARETAEIVADACGLPLEIAAGLREIGSGRWVEPEPGEPAREVTSADEDVVEDMDHATARVRSALERIMGHGRPFLGVTHLGAIRIARILRCDAPWESFGDFTPDNCQVARFQRDGSADRADEDAVRSATWEVHLE